MVTTRRKLAIFAVACMVSGFAGGAFLAWAKSPHDQAGAVVVAQAFLSRLENRDLAGAHDLTVKSGHAGRSVEEFGKLVQGEADACWRGQFRSSHPPQTNGNRLRRWLQGESMDMQEVNLEFVQGTCLLSVRLRRTSDPGWKVYYFASHAG